MYVLWSISMPMGIIMTKILFSKKLSLLLHLEIMGLYPFEYNKLSNYNFMTKAAIVNEVAKATGIEKITVQTVVEAFMESVKGSLAKGEPVYLRGFGSFIIKHRAEKAARNITKNTTMTIPAHDIPAFKPAKVFVASVKK